MHPLTKVALAAAAAWASRRLLRSIPVVRQLSLDELLPTHKLTAGFVVGALVYGYGILSEQQRILSEEMDFDDEGLEPQELSDAEDTEEEEEERGRARSLVELNPTGEA